MHPAKKHSSCDDLDSNFHTYLKTQTPSCYNNSGIPPPNVVPRVNHTYKKIKTNAATSHGGTGMLQRKKKNLNL